VYLSAFVCDDCATQNTGTPIAMAIPKIAA